jgi:hypothetical protein
LRGCVDTTAGASIFPGLRREVVANLHFDPALIICTKVAAEGQTWKLTAKPQGEAEQACETGELGFDPQKGIKTRIVITFAQFSWHRIAS